MKYKIINSDVYSGLLSLENNTIDVAITSPPYWNQRDYGFENQIGNEPNYKDYILKLVKIFNVLRSKISGNGVFFLNIGDKYLSKYGKSPLGMIPYELAYLMVKDGWLLNEIIIWVKPNHMPSSIKNRFTNSYEPVFVFSKSIKNIFTSKKSYTSAYSNILKIPLQPTPYKHVAVYPEKLVAQLLEKVELSEEATVLDPFAGSGTTLKVIKDLHKSCICIAIESNEKYVEIIKKRCNLNGNAEVIKFDFVHYYSDYYSDTENYTLFDPLFTYNLNISRKGFIKIFSNKISYLSFLELFEKQSLKLSLEKSATCFVGCKEFDIDLIHETARLNKKGWVIRNMLVVEEGNLWFPVFMIVDDNKSTDYVFNYKKLNLKSKNNYIRNWAETNFVGYRVHDSVSKKSREGVIVKINERFSSGFPKYVIVKWANNKLSKEYIINSQEQVNENIKIKLDNQNLIVFEKEILVDIDKCIDSTEGFGNYSSFNLSNVLQSYNGKFKEENRKNWGASPGARSSVEKEYFSLQRLYEVDQNIIVDYLNSKRIQEGLTKSELTNLFPINYKHTVGHWLRKDFGGSLPTPEDWDKLSKILNIEKEITNYICKTALKLQTVKNGEYKMPQDFISSEFINKLNDLIY